MSFNDHRHPTQRKALDRKNQLLGIIEDNQGIEKKKLISKCYTVHGWFPRTTREHIDCLLETELLVSEGELLFTASYHPKEEQTKLTDLSIIVDKMPVQIDEHGRVTEN